MPSGSTSVNSSSVSLSIFATSAFTSVSYLAVQSMAPSLFVSSGSTAFQEPVYVSYGSRLPSYSKRISITPPALYSTNRA